MWPGTIHAPVNCGGLGEVFAKAAGDRSEQFARQGQQTGGRSGGGRGRWWGDMAAVGKGKASWRRLAYVPLVGGSELGGIGGHARMHRAVRGDANHAQI
jgi:hypothetical protein